MPLTLRCKVIIAGDSTVGKSALSQIYHSDGSHFPRNYTMTPAVELCDKPVPIPNTQGDQVELYIFSSAGKEVIVDFTMNHWDNPGAIMIVYDVTNEASFSSCAKWLERVRSRYPSGGQAIEVLVANKCDLRKRRVISTKEGKEFADNNKMEYFETSAREYENVNKPFVHIATAFYSLHKEKIEQYRMLQ